MDASHGALANGPLVRDLSSFGCWTDVWMLSYVVLEPMHPWPVWHPFDGPGVNEPVPHEKVPCI